MTVRDNVITPTGGIEASCVEPEMVGGDPIAILIQKSEYMYAMYEQEIPRSLTADPHMMSEVT